MSRENSSLKRKTAIQNIAHLFVVCEVGITLPPIIMEVENGVLEDVFNLQMGYFPLAWLWEEG